MEILGGPAKLGGEVPLQDFPYLCPFALIAVDVPDSTERLLRVVPADAG